MNSSPATLTHEEVESLLKRFFETHFSDFSRRQKTFHASDGEMPSSLKISYALTQRDYRTNKYRQGEILLLSETFARKKYRFSTLSELEDILGSILTTLRSGEQTQLPLL